MLLKLGLKVITRPREALHHLKTVSLKSSFSYAFVLASVGSILSFVSLYFFEGENVFKVITYSLLIYILDIISVVCFGFYLSIWGKIDIKTALNISIFATTPVWLSDIVDLYQPLRPLSTLGLLYSIYILFLWLRSLKLKKILLHVGTYLVLYILNAFISEVFFQNPLVKKILNF